MFPPEPPEIREIPVGGRDVTVRDLLGTPEGVGVVEGLVDLGGGTRVPATGHIDADQSAGAPNLAATAFLGVPGLLRGVVVVTGEPGTPLPDTVITASHGHAPE